MSMKNIKRFEDMFESVSPQTTNWYHGTPDSRGVDEAGGFTEKTKYVEYVDDIKEYKEIQSKLKYHREKDEMDVYFKLLDLIGGLRQKYEYKSPLFLSDKYSVAKTYADDSRAFDYQNSIEKVYNIEVECNRVVRVSAYGDRFRFIGVDKVKQGFINAGISEQEITEVIEMFNFSVQSDKGIKTDVIAAIGNWFNFDCIDVLGVFDSYNGGTVKSTVRMVLDPTKAKIV